MRKREIFTILVLLVVVWAYFHFFSEVGQKPVMIVTASLRPAVARVGGGGMRRGGFGRGAGTNGAFGRGGFGRGGGGRGGVVGGGADAGTNLPVLFELLNPYKLSSLKVVEVNTNTVKAEEHILWHLVSTNGSDPVKNFFYGANLQGMTPYLAGVTPEPLLPHVSYRLELEAGEIKGSTVFQTTEK